jgi:2-polyprenyl-3-methyl-5-hydroxy-6-metoxy-1,4-benzoquinol methylase
MTSDDAALLRYYDQRAEEYDEIYTPRDVTHGHELGDVGRALRETLRDRRVLEIACGTGYWTAAAAQVAREVVATDASLPMLVIARQKVLPPNVRLLQANAYDLASAGEGFDGALAMFWLSHVPRRHLGDFLGALHGRLGPGARVFFADNVHVPGVGGDLTAPDANGDTFKMRALADGSRHRILKNYFSDEELRALLGPPTQDLVLWRGCNFWSASYTRG